jgi:hypothetical protein
MRLKLPAIIADIKRSQWWAASTLILSVICLLGWVSNNLVLASFGSSLIMMAPSTAICFFMLGVALYGLSGFARHKPVAILCFRGLVVISALISLAILGAFMAGSESIVERIVHPASGRLGEIPTGRMSSITACLFLFSSTALSFCAFPAYLRKQAFNILCGSLCILTVLIGATFIVGYWYGVPFFYNSSFVPPALPTVLCFVTLSVGIFCLVGSGSSIFAPLINDSVFGRFTRALLPPIVLLVLLEGWGDVMNVHLFSNPAVSHAAISLLVVTTIVLMVLFLTRRIGAQLLNAERRAREG